jgi:hypothetical protein
MKDRFGLELVVTSKLDSKHKYIFGLHPHGILPFGSCQLAVPAPAQLWICTRKCWCIFRWNVEFPVWRQLPEGAASKR